MRQIVLDTETTGLEPAQGHRIIEIGCVELVNRRLTNNRYHQYINPEREIDEGAVEVHGITSEFLADKPRFVEVAEDFVNFIRGAELIIHNAPFDVGFINHELRRLEAGSQPVDDFCRVIDTLVMARQLHPGQKNNLDALCKRYSIDNSSRELHGALLDAEILAEVYLAMTGGQVTLSLEGRGASEATGRPETRRPLAADRPPLKILHASEDELRAHQARLDTIDGASDGQCLWRRLEP
ncbi:DNA polymerase III subunit epsilon [Thiohalophilus sp.]|uniref:DNA polymerase III subunit epsilon n=1 Tax=Thiohalophilus sp. TaxID=3028392 RepID=UPI002ACD3ADF|nr:DNA polymerase III subunit epsilon [Thiohalophilus sp.]MDZ7804290.1 DNA polymerase III subunit epsilon [Thiohalophilus sp.]